MILYNYGSDQIVLKKNTQIAQLILEKIDEAEMEVVHQLDPISRDANDFGSTGMTPTLNAPTKSQNDLHNKILHEPYELGPIVNNLEIEQQVNICMAMNGDGPYLNIDISVRGNHQSLGLNIKSNKAGQPIVIDFKSGTPACYIPKWRSTLKM